MSRTVTEASARRMAERDHFVGLGTAPYIDIIDPATGLPVLSLRIEGRPESRERADWFLTVIGQEADRLGLRLKQRQTA